MITGTPPSAHNRSIDASYSTLSFDYTRIDPTLTTVTKGMIAPYTPETKMSFGLQYEFMLRNKGTVTPRIDASYTDQVYAQAVNAPTNLIPAYTLLNTRITWHAPNNPWQFAVEGTNLTNKYYYVTLFDLMSAAGYIHGQPSRPREWAMTFKRTF